MCGGGSPCRNVRGCLLLGDRVGGFTAVGLSKGVKNCVLEYGMIMV